AVEVDGAQAPVVMEVPLGAGLGDVGAVALGRLEVVRPQEHALVPVDRSDAHGTLPRGGADAGPGAGSLPGPGTVRHDSRSGYPEARGPAGGVRGGGPTGCLAPGGRLH